MNSMSDLINRGTSKNGQIIKLILVLSTFLSLQKMDQENMKQEEKIENYVHNLWLSQKCAILNE